MSNARKSRTRIKRQIAFENRNGGKCAYRSAVNHPERVPKSAKEEMHRKVYGLEPKGEKHEDVHGQSGETVHGNAINHHAAGAAGIPGIQGPGKAAGKDVVEPPSDDALSEDTR